MPLLQTIADFWSNERTNKANKKLAEYQYGKQLEMWNMSNEYNSPANQMKRYKEAGLNPNLIYSQGNPGNTATTMPQYQAPRVQYGIRAELGIPDIISRYQNIKQSNAQIDLVRKQQENIDSDILVKKQRLGVGATEWQRKQLELDIAKSLQESRIRKYSLDVQNTEYRNSMLQIQKKGAEISNNLATQKYEFNKQKMQKDLQHLQLMIELSQIQKDYNSIGLFPNKDPWYIRGAGRTIEGIGNLIKKAYNPDSVKKQWEEMP